MSGPYFVAPNADDHMALWKENGDYPKEVVVDVEFREHPEVWAALVAWAGAYTGPCPSVGPNGLPCSWPAEHSGSWHGDADGTFNWQDDAR